MVSCNKQTGIYLGKLQRPETSRRCWTLFTIASAGGQTEDVWLPGLGILTQFLQIHPHDYINMGGLLILSPSTQMALQIMI